MPDRVLSAEEVEAMPEGVRSAETWEQVYAFVDALARSHEALREERDAHCVGEWCGVCTPEEDSDE